MSMSPRDKVRGRSNVSEDDDCNYYSSNHRHAEGRQWSDGEYSDEDSRSKDDWTCKPKDDRTSELDYRSLNRKTVGEDRSDRERTRHHSRDRHHRHAERKSHHHHKEKKKSHRRRSHRRSSRSSSSSSKSQSKSRSRSRHRRPSSKRRQRSNSHSDCSREGYSDVEWRRRLPDTRYEQLHDTTPSETVMIRGLALHLNETDIHENVQQCGINVKDIRLIRNRESGTSRGFAFVEFDSVEDAVRYMEIKKGVVIFQDQYESTVIYSVSKTTLDRMNALTDWFCTKCAAHNFKRRELCYRCHSSKSETGICESEEITKYATSTLLLKNLDTLTTEDNILTAFEQRSDLLSIQTKSVKVSREPVTNLSRGICFVETNTVSDAVRLYDCLIQTPLEVDERILTVAYCKQPTQTVALNSAAAAALAAAQWTVSSSKKKNISETEIQRMAEYSASLYAKSPEEKASYLAYYLNYYRKQHSKGEMLPTGPATMQTPVQSGSIPSSSAGNGDPPNRSASPDMNRLQFDESTSYYYDPITLLYYDGNTQYFYDSIRMVYLYWDSTKREYVSVANSNVEHSSTSSEKTDDKKGKSKDSKIKVSKSVLKDTLKQAATFNEKKFDTERSVKIETPNYSSKVIATASSESFVQDSKRYAHAARITDMTVSTIAEPFEKNSESEDESNLQDFMDLEKLACTLCKRQFPKLEILQKHTEFSSLHKTNLAKLSSAEVINAASSSSSAYRDRAKERRKHFGPEITEVNNCLKEVYRQVKTADEKILYTASSTEAIREDNIGNRMLKKMGWKSGTGLGKNESGSVDIITSELRANKAGLGMPASAVPASADRYTKARHVTLCRYRELEEKTNTT